MKTLNKVIATVCASVLAAGTVVAGGHGSVADFYKGKTVELYIGYDPGGGYDTYARLVARHIGKHIPGNPNVVPKNMPGAGSVKLANWLWEAAPKDGTVFGAISRGAPFEPVLGNDKAKFKANKYTWIGSANNEVSVCATMKKNGITNWEQLKTQELTVGGNGSGSDTEQFPKLMNAVLGTKFKVIGPYGGGSDIVKAMEAGELGGRCGWSWSSVKATKADLLASGDLVLLMQMSGSKHPELPNVPLVMDLAKTKEERQMLNLIFARQALGRPFLAPPDLPADRAKALQDAFMAMVNDPAFLAEAKKMDLELSPLSGAEVAALVAESYDTPQAVVDRAIAAIR